jgi:hypothetical protein
MPELYLVSALASGRFVQSGQGSSNESFNEALSEA